MTKGVQEKKKDLVTKFVFGRFGAVEVQGFSFQFFSLEIICFVYINFF